MFKQIVFISSLIFFMNTASATLSDPTRPPASSVALPAAPAETVPAPELRVTAIYIGGQGRHALINGMPLRIGDTVADATVTAITPQFVTVQRKNGTILHLHLFASIKRSSLKE